MKWKAVGMTLVASFALVACQNDDQGNETGQGLDNGVEQTRFNNTTDYPNDGRNNDNVRNMEDGGNNNTGNNNTGNNNGANGNENDYEVADKVADEIKKQVKEVDDVNVLTTDNNAYVAAEVSNNNGGNGNQDNAAQNGNNTGTQEIANENGNNGNGNGNNNDGNNGNNDNGNEVSDEIKKKISKVVKSVDKDIDNVYVSANPDFVGLTNDYVKDVNNGEPVEGFFKQFGDMVERVFPQNK